VSFIAPILPANAPFSPAQRAWIDGYLAGLLSDTEAGHPASAPPRAAEAARPASAELEDFPWHDPALNLEERLTLAEGRTPARRLMAAMAQLD